MNKNSSISTETEINCSENIDYDVVIKQFDELISELTNSEDNDKNCSNACNLSDIVQENTLKNNVKNLSEKVSCSENYRDNPVSKMRASEIKIDPVELNNRNYVQKDRYDCYALSDKRLNESCALGTRGNISWIDSNLWSSENEKQSYQFRKPISQVKKNDLDVLPGSSKGMHLNITQPTAGNISHTDVLNPAIFYTMQAPKKKEIVYSPYTGIVKTDCRRFPYSEAYFKNMNACNSNFQAVKMGSAVSLQKSPKISRSPVSKYMLPNNCFVVKLFIETRDLHLGPFPFEIYPKMSLRLLKLKVEQEHGIVSSSQRWILGKCLAVDNEKSLVDYNVIPGSSIILYVDNNQRISYDASKNEFVGVRNAIPISNKVVYHDTADERKEGIAVFESLHSKPKQMEASELMTNSLDSVPSHSCSKSDKDYSVKSQSNENISVIKEQHINSALGGGICDKTKSPMIRKKGLKKSAELKKRAKNVVPMQLDILSDDYNEKSVFDKVKSNNFNSQDVFLKEKVLSAGNSLNPVEIEATYESKSDQSQEASSHDVLNTFPINNSDILNVHNQPNSLEEAACTSLNSSLRSSVKDIKLPETFESFLFRDILEGNLPGSQIHLSSQDLIKNSSDYKNRNEVMDNKDSSISITERNDNISNESLAKDKEARGLNLSNVNISTENDIMKHLHDETVVEKISFDEHNKNERKNVYDLSANISGKPNTEDLLPAKESENLINPNMSNLKEIESVENSHNKIISLESNVPKPKRSVTSLIRKLSLTRKGKSLDDSSCSHNISSNTFHNERTDEKTSKQATLISNQSPYNDIHIEISPQNLDPFSAKDEITEQCEKKVLLEDQTIHNPESVKNFELLLEIENMDLVENATNFICPVCFDEFESGQGVILHDCLHMFCRVCLANAINYAEGALVKCPYRDDLYSCQSHLQQREIKALVSEGVYEKYLQRSIITAEGSEERSFHCKTLDCPGWCIYDNAINVFHCPVCFHYNCLNCQAIHEGLNCRQYQDKLKLQQKVDQDAQKTLNLLNKMIEAGKALRCPKCDLILMKKWGCDWLKCSICQTEICWITKGPRWGPGGQGDTSGGCKCGVNGVKCHPSCTYCH